MTKVSILPVPTSSGGLLYRAVAGDRSFEGRTVGEALDALARQLPAEESGTLVIVQTWQPDRLFSAQQHRRLQELMERWRQARDRAQDLPAAEQAELDALVDAELRASAERSRALLEELGR